MLKIFNTLSRTKEEFRPINGGMIGMYVCGMTVYDLCHIGHGRTFAVFDIIARYLRYLGYNLNYVRNITDIDDKIIKRAKHADTGITCLTQCMIHEMHQDLSALNILPPNHEPRATQYISEMILLIEKLIMRKYAYISHNGDVMFSVEKSSRYGCLSQQNLMNLNAGARVTFITDIKKNPLDFVLWKASKEDEPFWESPWGHGRPGWHIECSAMNHKQLGQHFDIHGGGSDLMFPHHENEIAQSTCAYNTPYVNYWMHSGMVMIDCEKMSKSLDNFLTVREILQHHDGETVRYFLISSHYRSQVNYNKDSLIQARSALERLYIALQHTDKNAHLSSGEEFAQRFFEAMDDDFNTPVACAVLFDLAREINRKKTTDTRLANSLAVRLRCLGGVLGLLEQDPGQFLKKHGLNCKDDTHSTIEDLIQIRLHARKNKNWKKADSIRNYLDEHMGVLLEDRVDGTQWRNK
ncbi:Cysteine--tRNA ligase [Candidatus Erwinia haradaeae]|uniref:Cysteine--tRNA ligase n=1 Tax=Candidatus Erwinia haradaeae TaxID=1922217 RepID=A0A451DJM2_9GAMM|nr:cysteine--tRNA ligase [Candidatus Erwinia haradaeae]VFP86911.1 Cysteine--tRNA ligase [Candidatus Erwinia haradaeae]